LQRPSRSHHDCTDFFGGAINQLNAPAVHGTIYCNISRWCDIASTRYGRLQKKNEKSISQTTDQRSTARSHPNDYPEDRQTLSAPTPWADYPRPSLNSPPGTWPDYRGRIAGNTALGSGMALCFPSWRYQGRRWHQAARLGNTCWAGIRL